MHGNRSASRLASAVIAVLPAAAMALAAPGTAGAQAARENLNNHEREEFRRLTLMLNRVAENDLPGGDAWLKWNAHFLRAADGKTYVPFTLTIDEIPEGFDKVGVYIRVDRQRDPEEEERLRSDDLTDAGIGQTPVNVAERQFAGRGVPTAGEAAANLAMLEGSLRIDDSVRPPFEDVHFLEPEDVDGSDTKYVQRALAVEPGTYDLFVAVRETLDRDRDAARGAVLKQTLIVPDLGGDTLTTSSVVLAERFSMLPAPLSPEEQLSQPYTLGNVQIEPASDIRYRPDEELSLIFLAYNMSSREGAPDMSVQYRFYQVGIDERLVSAGQPLAVNGQTLPPGFDLEAAGRQLPVTYAVPLESFPPGPYRLEVLVTDNIADTAVTRDVTFIVEDGGR